MKKFIAGIILCSGLLLSGALVSGQEDGADKNTQSAAGQDVRQEAVDDGLITMDFKEADIKNILRIISYKANINIIPSPEVSGLVNIRLENVDWKKALEVICRSYGYGYEWMDTKVIMVMPLDKLKTQREAQKAAEEREPLGTKVFILKFAKAVDVQNAVKDLLSETGKITIEPRTNVVVVTDTNSRLAKMSEVIMSLDGVTRQVLIEVKVVETNLSKDENLGIKWNTKIAIAGSKRPTTFPFTEGSMAPNVSKYFPKVTTPASLAYPESVTYDSNGNPIVTQDSEQMYNKLVPGMPSLYDNKIMDSTVVKQYFSYGTLDFSQVQLLLEALSQRSGTNIISNPQIVTLDNSPAVINVGTEWPIPNYTYNSEQGRWQIAGFKYKRFGVTLNVTPQINPDGYVTLNIVPEISERVGEVAFGTEAILPLINSQKISTKVMIRNGRTLVIGGLIKEKKGDDIVKIPFLGDIPVLGNFFKHKSKSSEKKDLLIFISPKVLTVDDPSVDIAPPMLKHEPIN